MQAFAPSVTMANLSFQYLIPLARFGEPRSNDPVLGRELWEWFEEQVKIFEGSNWMPDE